MRVITVLLKILAIVCVCIGVGIRLVAPYTFSPHLRGETALIPLFLILGTSFLVTLVIGAPNRCCATPATTSGGKRG